MGWEASLLLCVLMVVALLAGGVWVGVAMGFTGLVGITILSGTDLWESLGFILWNTSNSFTMTAVPLFVLMGEIILVSGLSKRFYGGISSWLQPIPGYRGGWLIPTSWRAPLFRPSRDPQLPPQ